MKVYIIYNDPKGTIVKVFSDELKARKWVNEENEIYLIKKYSYHEYKVEVDEG